MPEWLVLSFTVFGVIFLLELPDKTALATLVLATRHRPLPVFAGAAAAFVVQTVVAVAAGSLFAFLPRDAVRVVAGLSFLVLAAATALTNRPKKREEEQEVEKVEQRFHAPLLSAFVVVFVAEWGDLSQLATAAFQARYQQPVLVFTAALLALWSVAAIAALAGNRVGKLVPERPLQYAAAAVMTVVALLLLSGVLG
jgi:putative Ca2+/H+ antiporter (TMEM165/GDT1 family)